mgnify:CR=1 FL=1
MSIPVYEDYYTRRAGGGAMIHQKHRIYCSLCRISMIATKAFLFNGLDYTIVICLAHITL